MHKPEAIFAVIGTAEKESTYEPDKKVFNIKKTVFLWKNIRMMIDPSNWAIKSLDRDQIEKILFNEIRKSDPLLAAEKKKISIVLNRLGEADTY